MPSPSAIQSAITNLEAVLVNITSSPQPSYTLNGKTVNWQEYRDSIVANLKELYQYYNQANPYIIRTRQSL